MDWRNLKNDRARAAYDNFHDLTGKFDNNVIIQITHGPIDFQVREPHEDGITPVRDGITPVNRSDVDFAPGCFERLDPAALQWRKQRSVAGDAVGLP